LKAKIAITVSKTKLSYCSQARRDGIIKFGKQLIVELVRWSKKKICLLWE